MTKDRLIKNLSVPADKIDVVIDTDTYNEIDDQFALSYLLLSKEKLNTKAIYAAPFLNTRSTSPEDGMKKSYEEILKLLQIIGEEYPVFKGSEKFLDNEREPVPSEAAKDLAERAEHYTPESPLYVVAIGAITNVASALLINPKIAENIVIVWLGGNGLHYKDTAEFNMRQDVAAARVVMSCGAPFVQLPCMGVVSSFTVSKPELEHWLIGKNPLADYLAKGAIEEADSYAAGKPWTRCIWDVTAIAWLLNDNDRFMESKIISTPEPTYDNKYAPSLTERPMRYVYHINRDELMEDLFSKILKKG